MELLNYTTEFGKSRGDYPQLPIINFIVESVDPEGKLVLQSRPGLQEVTSLSTDPVRALYSEPGIFNESLFAVVGPTVYRDTTPVGSIVGSGAVSIDSFDGNTFFTAGGPLYVYTGTLNTVPFPDNADTLKVVVGASRLVVIQKDSQTIYWSDPLTAEIDALDFAQAENSPDRLLDMLFLGDTLILFGESTVEFWPVQPSGDLPFTPLPGRAFSKGIKNTGATTKLGSGFAWVTDTNQVCFNTPDNIISTREIETEIETAGEVTLWNFYLDSIEFLAIRVGDRTHVWNTTNKTTTEFKTYGASNWEVSCYANGYFGSSIAGKTMAWADTYDDEGRDIERLFRVWYPFDMATTVVYNVFMRTNVGTTPYSQGSYSYPEIEMRTSKDGGHTFSSWRASTTGATGDYRKQVKWFRLGVFAYPGALAEFRITDPVPFRVSSVKVNEPYGGY